MAHRIPDLAAPFTSSTTGAELVQQLRNKHYSYISPENRVAIVEFLMTELCDHPHIRGEVSDQAMRLPDLKRAVRTTRGEVQLSLPL